MMRPKDRADLNSKTQTKQEGKCRDCELGSLARSCDSTRTGSAEDWVRIPVDTLGGCHLPFSEDVVGRLGSPCSSAARNRRRLEVLGRAQHLTH